MGQTQMSPNKQQQGRNTQIKGNLEDRHGIKLTKIHETRKHSDMQCNNFLAVNDSLNRVYIGWAKQSNEERLKTIRADYSG